MGGDRETIASIVQYALDERPVGVEHVPTLEESAVYEVRLADRVVFGLVPRDVMDRIPGDPGSSRRALRGSDARRPTP